MNGPLQHVSVLDLTVARAGPTAARLLAGWGANLIKVEPPRTGSGRSATGGRRKSDEQLLAQGVITT